jgi:RHS repeat-associated protein
MRDGDGLHYLLIDHLDSIVRVLDSNRSLETDERYLHFGELRDTSGITETDFAFTGQRNLSDVGLMDYNARWYSPSIGRFVSPDTLIAQPGNPQALNRYAYAANNPLRYTDPSGHLYYTSGGICAEDDVISLEFYIADYISGNGSFDPIKKMLFEYGVDADSWNARIKVDIARAVVYLGSQMGYHLEKSGRDAFRSAYGISHENRFLFARGNADFGAITVGPRRIIFRVFYPNSAINTRFIIHELGHALNRRVAEMLGIEPWDEGSIYSHLKSEMDSTPALRRGDTYTNPATGDFWGFAGDHHDWQFTTKAELQFPGEIWAEVVGWTFGEWGANDAGNSRREYMHKAMELFLPLAVGLNP